MKLHLLLLLSVVILTGCATRSQTQPLVRGTLSRQDVADVVSSVKQTSTDRILWIEESFGEVNAYTGKESGGIVYLFRRQSGRLQGFGGGYWDGRPQKSAWPLDPSLKYDLDR
jgi:hypothetical protein